MLKKGSTWTRTKKTFNEQRDILQKAFQLAGWNTGDTLVSEGKDQKWKDPTIIPAPYIQCAFCDKYCGKKVNIDTGQVLPNKNVRVTMLTNN